MNLIIALALLVVIAVAALAFRAKLYAQSVEQRYPPEGFEMQTGAGPIHLISFGDKSGVPVVLIHGAASSARDMAHAFEETAKRHGLCIYTPDRPGQGATPPFAQPVANRLEAHGRAIFAMMDALSLQEPIIVGHSYGGSVALRMALDAPAKLGGIVLLAVPSTAFVGPASWYNYVATWPIIGPFLRWIVPFVAGSQLKSGMVKTFHPQIPPADYVEKVGLARLFRPRAFLANAMDLSRLNRELAEQQPLYGDIDVPTAIIASPDDQVVYTERHSHPLARTITKAHLMLVPGGGHMPHYKAPDLVAEHILALHEGR